MDNHKPPPMLIRSDTNQLLSFQSITNKIKGQQFTTDEGDQQTVKNWSKAQPTELCKAGMNALIHCSTFVTAKPANYIEKQN